MRNENESTLIRLTMVVALAVLILTCCSGCTTVVPVTAKFPDAPSEAAMQSCPDLRKLDEASVLSSVAETVTDNYGMYYECAVKTETWIDWYTRQKKIFENAGK